METLSCRKNFMIEASSRSIISIFPQWSLSLCRCVTLPRGQSSSGKWWMFVPCVTLMIFSTLSWTSRQWTPCFVVTPHFWWRHKCWKSVSVCWKWMRPISGSLMALLSTESSTTSVSIWNSQSNPSSCPPCRVRKRACTMLICVGNRRAQICKVKRNGMKLRTR